MPFEATYPSLKPVPASSLRWIGWALAIFAMINLGVWYVFDGRFFELAWRGRLMNDPSEQEIRSVIDDIEREDGRNVILVGDSTVWGIDIGQEETFSGILESMMEPEGTRVINLSSPGLTFADQYAIIEHAYRPEDTYVFFVNPIWFRKGHDERPFSTLIRFPHMIEESLQEETEDLAACCAIVLEAENGLIVIARRLMHELLPIYRNRDVINKALLRMHPRRAEDAVLNRFRDLLSKDKTVRPEESIPLAEDIMPSFVLEETRNYALLNIVLKKLRDKPNIRYVILDEYWFERDARLERSMRALERSLGETGPMLNLHRTHTSAMFRDHTHLSLEGHRYVAKRLFPFLHAD